MEVGERKGGSGCGHRGDYTVGDARTTRHTDDVFQPRTSQARVGLPSTGASPRNVLGFLSTRGSVFRTSILREIKAASLFLT